MRYIEVTREDIRLANALAASVLGQSADELTAPARTLLGHIHALDKEQSEAQNTAPADFVFTRKTVRDAIGWSEWQARMHLGELEALEYVRARQGTWGKEYSYQLLADPDAAPVQFVLTDPDTLLEPAAWATRRTSWFQVATSWMLRGAFMAGAGHAANPMMQGVLPLGAPDCVCRPRTPAGGEMHEDHGRD